MFVHEIVAAELHGLKASSIKIISNRRHPRIHATFGDRALIMVVPRGKARDRGHLKNNYISQTRKRVRELLAGQ